MPSIKNYIVDAIQQTPEQYAVDSGDLKLINDYFALQGWKPLNINQHKAIAAIIRHRNYFLRENETYDYRTKSTAYVYAGQTSIYDFLDDDTKVQLPKIVRFWNADTTRYDYSNSRLKKSIRGVDDEHIEAARIMLPLLAANPILKQKKVKKSPNVETVQSTYPKEFNNVFDSKMETSFSEVKGR